MKRVMVLLFSCMFLMSYVLSMIEPSYAIENKSIFDYEVIYTNFNIDAVKSGPKEKFTGFTIKKDVVITSITTYHYFNKGKEPGQIALVDEKGTNYGVWNTVGRVGQGGVKNAYWDATMNVKLKASDNTVYGITVNDTSGWSYNDKSNGQGFVEVRGYSLKEEPKKEEPKKEEPSIQKPVQEVKKEENSIKEVVEVSKIKSIGNISKNQWVINIPANAFDKNTEVKVDSIKDTSKFKKSGTKIIGEMIDISSSQGKASRMNKAVSITMKLSVSEKVDLANIDDYVAAYWTGTEWEYIFPNIEELKKGLVTFETFHFSPYAMLKLDEKEKVNIYVRKMAVQQWANSSNKELVMENIQDTFKVAFEKMGLSDSTAQGEIIRAIIAENDFGSLIVSAERGDVASYTSKCGQMVANALIQKYKKGDEYLKGLAGKGAAAATGVGKGLIQVYDGNYKKAAEELSLAFVNYFPYGRAFTATKDAINKGINQWKEAEVEYAYKSYVGLVGDGVYGYVKTDDWNLLMQQMRGALVRMQQEAKLAYAEEKGISIDAVYKDKKLSAEIDKKVTDNLKKSFERRKTNETNIKNREAEYTKIVEGFLKDGLLTRGKFRFDVSSDIESRLRSLFAIRENILGIFDGKMPTLKIGESAEANLNEAIGVWIQFGSKDRDKFYEWLEKKGYFGKSKKTSTEEEDPNKNTPFNTGPVTPHGADSPFNVTPGTGTKNPSN